MIHERIVEWFAGWPPPLVVFVVSTIPILEVRAAIPLGLLYYDMGIWSTAAWSFAGNLAPVPFLLRGLPLLERWAHRWERLGRLMDRFLAFTRRRSSPKVERAEEVGLALFVALPLPGAGTWSGALGAHVLGLPLRSSLISIFIGAVIEVALITAAVVTGRFLWLLVV